MKRWKWDQADTTLIVVSDKVEGFIRVYKDDTLIFERKDLSPKEVEIVEDYFLKNVTGKGNEDLGYIR